MIKLLFFMVFFYTSLTADEKKEIFILHSYSQEYSWTKSQHEGFITSLTNSKVISEISTEYLDTKRVLFSNHYQKSFLSYLKEKYHDYSPDIIYSTDDNALKFLIAHKDEIFSNVPVIFSGVNNLSLQNRLNPQLFTGVYELKEIKPNIELIRQFSPQTRDIFLVGDNTDTYKEIEKKIREEINDFPKLRFYFHASKKLDDIITSIRELSHSKPFILLTTIGGFMDYNGNTLTLQTSLNKLSEIKNSVLMTMEDAYMYKGVIGGYVVSGSKQGSLAAEMVNQFLNGTALEMINPIVKGSNLYMFDKKELQNSRLILSEYIARDAVLKNKKISFFQEYQNIILNTLFLISILFIILLFIIFFVLREKNLKYQLLRTEFDEYIKQYK